MILPKIKTSSAPARVLIAIDASAAYQRQMLKGIINYAKQRRPGWEFLFHHRPESLAHKLKVHRNVSGIILHEPRPPVLSKKSATLLEQANVPTVLIEEVNDTYPMVLSDNKLIGQMAFEHLQSKGFENFAFYEQAGVWVFDQRRQAFEAAVQENGRRFFTPPAKLTALSHSPDKIEAVLGTWLSDLPKPLALFVGAIIPARHAIAACRKMNIAVPDEVAILGVGHDEVDCELIHPPLSAIDQGMGRGGYAAARLLDNMIQGGPAPCPAEPILVEPIGVVERQSTDVLAVEDPDVRKAVNWIRKNALDGAGIKQLLGDIPVSRRRLEVVFRQTIGRTLHQEIMRVRLDKAKYLLLNSPMSLPEIADNCGFTSDPRLVEAFKRQEKTTPWQYRKKFMGHN